MNARGMNNTDIHKLSGVSKEYIGEILKLNSEFKYSAGGGNIGDIPDNWFWMLAEVVGRNEEEDIWKPVPTIQLKNILSTLEESKKFGYTRVIIGETGSGKAYAVDKFVNDTPKENFKITVGSMDNISYLLDKILDTLKIKHGKSKSKKN